MLTDMSSEELLDFVKLDVSSASSTVNFTQ
jgi:hypothetical protein